MLCIMRKLLLNLFIVASLIPSLLWAQSQTDKGAERLIQESANDLLVVAGSGAGGAILGLSTLPFYAEPADHFKNVIVGGAIGVIVGVAVVAYMQASQTKDMYYDTAKHNLKLLPVEGEKYAFRMKGFEKQPEIPYFMLNFSF